MQNELWHLDAGALAAGYARGDFSPVDALRSVLDRLAVVQPRINAVVALDGAGALAAARASAERWRRGAPLSPMDGIPLTVKDNIPVAGLPCRWGSRLYEDFVPTRDELPVARLRAGGAVLLGKTNVPEFTLQGYTDNLLAGPTRNPWNLALTPGGSSGGAAAAVAAGVGPLALATDGGGSIRRPAGHTGLVGFKPGWGTVPRADGLPEILPGMEVIGPLARSVADVVRILQVIGEPAMNFAALLSSDAAPAATAARRIVYWRRIARSPVDPQILDRVDAVASRLRALGHTVSEEEAPAGIDDFNRTVWPVLSATGLAAVLQPHAGREALLTPALRAMLETGRSLRATDLFEAQRKVRAMREALRALFARCDCVLTPGAAALPWLAAESHPPVIDGQPVDGRGHAVFTAFANAAGLPALALPAEPAEGSLPIGFQLVGPHGGDAALLALGLAWEAAEKSGAEYRFASCISESNAFEIQYPSWQAAIYKSSLEPATP